MTILHVNDHLAAKGGVETYLLSVVPELERRGHEVHVAFGQGEDGLVTRSHRIPAIASIRGRDDGAAFDAVTALIGSIRPDVVHMHGIHSAGAIRAIVDSGSAVMTGHDFRPICPASNLFHKRTAKVCPRVCGPGCFAVTAAVHCMTPRPRPALYFYRRSRWIMRHAGRFRGLVAPSAAAGERYAQAGFPAGSIQVIPYFCPLPPEPGPRPLPATPTITFMGRATRTKGWETFVRALGRLEPDVRGLMVGNFDEAARSAIEALARDSGCRERLELRGWAGRDAVAEVYRQTSVFVFPSLWPETLGIVGIEALSQGVPVAASDIGGVREWLVEGETGRLAPPGNPERLAAVLSEMLADPTELDRMGRNGIALINEKFSPARHVDSLLRVYEKVT